MLGKEEKMDFGIVKIKDIGKERIAGGCGNGCNININGTKVSK